MSKGYKFRMPGGEIQMGLKVYIILIARERSGMLMGNLTAQKLRRSKQRIGFFPEMETPEKCPKFSKNC
ncbi:MAG: hypothetical protein ACLS3C_08515 [Oscillospiraceae bacterium]